MKRGLDPGGVTGYGCDGTMKFSGHKLSFVFFVIAFWYGTVGLTSVSAQYLDPGSGSYLLQIGIAAFLAALVFFKSAQAYSRGIVSRLLRRTSKNDPSDSA
jgi:hypothetical protein